MSRQASQPIWVLHRRPWRESSLLLEAFGSECGRVGLVARGARGARSPWRGLAEPFMPLSASWQGRGELGTVTLLEPRGSRAALQGEALWCGLYLNELLLRLLGREDAQPALFLAYEQALAALAEPGLAGFKPVLRRFEMALLEGLGVVPDLSRDGLTGAPIDADRYYRIVAESGPLPVAGPGPETFSGRALLALSGNGDAGPDTAREAQNLSRRLLDFQLGGRPLKTRELFIKTRASRTPDKTGPG